MPNPRPDPYCLDIGWVEYDHSAMKATIDIDGPILRDLKRLTAREGKPLGRLVSDLLAQALNARAVARATSSLPAWIAKPMRTLVDLTDKEAVRCTLDRE